MSMGSCGAGRRAGRVLLLLIPLMTAACSERTRVVRSGADGWFRTGLPDEQPQMTNSELPFRYPVHLFRQRVQGNVTLRLFVDSLGRVVTDSTQVVESSGQGAFDSAAVVDAARLRFRPAMQRGRPLAVSLLFPVHYRHPEASVTPSAMPDSVR
ncbi:energy transducer TonB [Gemmatimonas sp. UBA7669]|uniref:energy transducer TonB n=1 Tax=Gemmatimonas sp. UBA7669 TaxID=1946568 RepID=UPI0025C6C063|nr:energy transducer TonB [Gemmatimonas sp. UBA7669]